MNKISIITLSALLFLFRGLSFASTLNGSCRVTGNTFSPPSSPCEIVFTFTTPEITYGECASYLAEMDGETCRAAAPSGSCNYTQGYVLSAYCTGGGSGSSSLPGGGFDLSTSRFDPFGWESGSPFFTRHYGDTFREWSDEARERWRSYLYRNAIAKETGIAVWQDNPFYEYLEWFYRTLKSLNKSEKSSPSLFRSLDGSGDSEASSRYQLDYAAGPLADEREALAAEGPAEEEDVLTGNNSAGLYCDEMTEGSIAPYFGINYNSLYSEAVGTVALPPQMPEALTTAPDHVFEGKRGSEAVPDHVFEGKRGGGVSETAAMKLSPEGEGVFVFSDGRGGKYGFKSYVKFDERAKAAHFMAPAGSGYWLGYGKKRGFKLETPGNYVVEFSTKNSAGEWLVTRLIAPDGTRLDYEYGGNGLRKIRDIHGRYYGFDRDADGRLLGLEDSYGKKKSFQYDGSGRLIQVASLRSQVTSEEAAKQSPTKFLKEKGTMRRGGKEAGKQVSSQREGAEVSSASSNSSVQTSNSLTLQTSSSISSTSSMSSNASISYSYDANGYLSSVKKGNNAATLYSYDASGRLLSEELEEGVNRVERFYDDKSSRTVATDGLGGKTVYEYNNVKGKKEMKKVTDALGNTWRFGTPEDWKIGGSEDWKAAGNETSAFADPLGRETVVVKNANGDPVFLKDALGGATTIQYQKKYDYTEFGRLKTAWSSLPSEITNPLGLKTKFSYDKKGNLIKVTSQVSGLRFQVSGHGENEEVSDRSSNPPVLQSSIFYSYDKHGHLTSVKDPLGNKSKYKRKYFSSTDGSPLTAVLSLVDPLGREISYKYSADGKLKKLTDARGNSTGFAYDEAGNLVSVKGPYGGALKFSYGGEGCPSCGPGKITGVENALGGSWRFDSDKYGRLASLINPLGVKKEYSYDRMSRLVQVASHRSQVTSHKSQEENTNPTPEVGDNVVMADTAGVGKGLSTRYEYDALGRVVKKVLPDDAVSYEYDKAGNLLSIHALTPKPYTLSYSYDALNRVKQVTSSRSQVSGFSTSSALHSSPFTLHYAYDPNGNRTKMSSPFGGYKYAYDGLNRLTEIAVSTPGSVPEMGNNTVKADIAGTGTKPGAIIRFSYDPSGRRILKTILTSDLRPLTSVRYSYDKSGQLLSIKDETGGKKLSEIRYEYDPNGNITKVSSRRSQVTGKDSSGASMPSNSSMPSNASISYRYDKLNQLITVKYPDKRKEGFIYDKAGNRLNDRFIRNYKYNAANQLIGNSSFTYTYDLNGNMIGKVQTLPKCGSMSGQTETLRECERAKGAEGQSMTEYVYDAENRLKQVSSLKSQVTGKDSSGASISSTSSISSNASIAYAYDPLGRRISKTISSTLYPSPFTLYYVYDNDNLIAILDENNKLTASFTYGPGVDEPVIMSKADGTNYFYHSDALGSITYLTDEQGNIVESYKYSAYGVPTIKSHLRGSGNSPSLWGGCETSGAGAAKDSPGVGNKPCIVKESVIGNPFMFTGREYDSETRLYFYRARYYDPAIGRFISEDPIGFEGGDLNLYAYVRNNPVNFSDPTGEAIDIDKFVQKVDSNAQKKSQHSCAKAIRQGLEAGGIDASDRPQYAKDYGPFLKKNDFAVISIENYSPQKGDIIVFQPGPNPYGHIQVWNGVTWVSDFVQNPNKISPYSNQTPAYDIYRQKPPNSPGLWQNLINNMKNLLLGVSK